MRRWTLSTSLGAVLLIATASCGGSSTPAASSPDSGTPIQAANAPSDAVGPAPAAAEGSEAGAKLEPPVDLGDCTKPGDGCHVGDCAERCTDAAGAQCERTCPGGGCKLVREGTACRFDCPGGAVGSHFQVLIAGYRLRNHPMGEPAGDLFSTLPGWKSHIAGSDFNPVTDLDNVLLSGPLFRDSTDVVAVVELNVSPEKLHEAVDNLVKRSKGEWLKGTPVPVARVKVDRAFRLIALVPDKKLVVVLPLSKKSELGALKKMKRFSRTSKASIVVYLDDPHMTFGRVMKIPKSIFWMRLSLVPESDGGATLHLEAQDESPEAAANHAAQLTKELNAAIDCSIPKLNLSSRKALIDRFEFEADESIIRTSVIASPAQLSATLSTIESWLRSLETEKLKKE